ncbi:hypothetical protein D9M71_210080 [compost metagenome]
MGHLVEHGLGHALFALQVLMVKRKLVTLQQDSGLQAPQAVHRLDLGCQQQVVVGLDQHIIAARFQALHQRLLLAHRGQENDRHQRLSRQRLDLACGLETIEHRHQCIKQDQLRTLPGKQFNSLGAVGRGQYVVALALDDIGKQQAFGRTVFGDQYRQRLGRGHAQPWIWNRLSKLAIARILRTSELQLIRRTSAASPPP